MQRARLLLNRYFDAPYGLIAVAFGLGLGIRLSVVMGLDFVLNDGGFWYAFAKAVRDAGFALPHSIQFNGESVLATYPPLAAYVLAVLERFSGVGIVPLLIWVPFIISVAALVAFIAVALRLLGYTPSAYVSIFAFALLPVSYRTFLMGGGIARGLGLLFLLLSWLGLMRAYGEDSRRDFFLGGVCAGLAALSHPVAGLLAAVGGSLLLVRRERIVWAGAVVICAGTLVVGPWLFVMITRYGISPYMLAFKAGGQGANSVAIALVSLPTYGQLAVLNALVVVGIISAVLRGWFFGAQVFVAMLLLMPQKLSSDFGCIPFALLAGEGGAVIWNALKAASPTRSGSLMLSLVLLLFILVGDSGGYAKQVAGYTLTLQEVQQLQKLDELFGEPQKITVLSQSFVNGGDALGEWIGTLSKHRSVLTHQLREWTGDFAVVIDQQQKVEACCAKPTAKCVETVLALSQKIEKGILIWTHRSSCRGLELEMLASKRCEPIFPDQVPMMLCF
jgi:hypothetical protein